MTDLLRGYRGQTFLIVLFVATFLRPFGEPGYDPLLSLGVVAAVFAALAMVFRGELWLAWRRLRGRPFETAAAATAVGFLISVGEAVQRVSVEPGGSLVTQVAYPALVTLVFIGLLLVIRRVGVGGWPWAVMGLVVAVHLFALWLLLDPAGADAIYHWTRGGEWAYRQLWRYPSVFSNPTVYGSIGGMLLLFWVAWLSERSALPMAPWRRWRDGVAVAIVVVASGIGLAVSQSVAGVAGVVAGLVVMAASSRRGRRWVLAVLFCGVVAVHMYAALDPWFASHAGRTLPYLLDLRQYVAPERPLPAVDLPVDPWHGRLRIWAAALGYVRDAPLFGIGYGQFRVEMDGLHNVHNLYLQVLAEGGLVMFVPFVAMLSIIGWRLRGTAWLGVYVGVLVTHVPNNLFDYSLPWAVSAAWVAAHFRPAREVAGTGEEEGAGGGEGFAVARRTEVSGDAVAPVGPRKG
ncbi:O-antigen ligase family protein [Endothiovibrio diazotrophicus]